jgi:putative addiction module component (TIGR02574 family)
MQFRNQAMSDQLQIILDAALVLSEPEREILVECLLESLPSEQTELSDEELYAELERRRTEFEKDPSTAIPWEEVRRQLWEDK